MAPEDSCYQSFGPVLSAFMEKITVHSEMLEGNVHKQQTRCDQGPSCRNVPVVHKHLASMHDTFSCSTPMAICFSDLSDLSSF